MVDYTGGNILFGGIHKNVPHYDNAWKIKGAMSKNSVRALDFSKINFFAVSVLVIFFISKRNLLSEPTYIWFYEEIFSALYF